MRNTPCIYRDYIRHRRKKHEYEEAGERNSPRQASSSGVPPSGQHTASVMNDFPNSVSATHMASPSCQMQLYYGPTSHFSLMQHIYRDLISNPTSHPEPSGGVEEAGAVLDLFSFRRIFFGTPDIHESIKSLGTGELSTMFLPYDLAKLFLSRFLSSFYHLMPYRPKMYYEHCLNRLYSSSPTEHLDALTRAIVLLAMATAALGTEHFAWGDVLFERVKASLTAFDDVVNLQTIQISVLMISPYYLVLLSCYQTNIGFTPITRTNKLGPTQCSCIWVLLVAKPYQQVCIRMCPMMLIKPRKTSKKDGLPSGLFTYSKRTSPLSLRSTVNSLTSCSWFCFHVGRPSSLSLKDVAIEYAQDPFIRLLVQLCKSTSRSVNEIYGQRHESLLHMWRVARSIADDIRGHEPHVQQALGVGLDDHIQAGSLGVRQIIFITRKLTVETLSTPLTRPSILSYPTSYISPVRDISRPLAAREEYRTQPVQCQCHQSP